MSDYPMTLVHADVAGEVIAQDVRAARIFAASGWAPKTAPAGPAPVAADPSVPSEAATKAVWEKYAESVAVDVDTKLLKAAYVAAVKAAVAERAAQAATPAEDVPSGFDGTHKTEPTGEVDETNKEA